MGASVFDGVVMALTKRKMQPFFRALIKDLFSFSLQRKGDEIVPIPRLPRKWQ